MIGNVKGTPGVIKYWYWPEEGESLEYQIDDVDDASNGNGVYFRVRGHTSQGHWFCTSALRILFVESNEVAGLTMR